MASTGKRIAVAGAIGYNVLREAERAGVEHVVFVAAIHANALAARGVGPAVARETVVEAVKASQRRWTVVRGTGFFNDTAELFGMARRRRARPHG